MDFLAANHVRIFGLCGQNWNRTLGYSFALRSVQACVPEMLLSIWLLCTTPPHCMGLACRGRGCWAVHTAQFTVYSLRTAARPIPKGMTIFCLPILWSTWPVFGQLYYPSCLWNNVSSVCLSVCVILYCGEMVRPSENVSEGVNRKPG